MLLDDLGVVQVMVGLRHRSEHLLRCRSKLLRLPALLIRVGARRGSLPECLLFELFELLQPFLLNLAQFLDFPPDSVQFLGFLRVALHRLEHQRVLHLGAELGLAAFCFARELAGPENSRLTLLPHFLHVSLLLLDLRCQ